MLECAEKKARRECWYLYNYEEENKNKVFKTCQDHPGKNFSTEEKKYFL